MKNNTKIDLKDGYTINEDGALLYKDDVILSQHQTEGIIRLIRYKSRIAGAKLNEQVQEQIADTMRALFY